MIKGAIDKNADIEDLYDEYYNAPDMYDSVDDGNEDLFASLSYIERYEYLAEYWDAYLDAIGSQRIEGITGLVMAGTGLAAVATGVILFFVRNPSSGNIRGTTANMSAVISPFETRIKISF